MLVNFDVLWKNKFPQTSARKAALTHTLPFRRHARPFTVACNVTCSLNLSIESQSSLYARYFIQNATLRSLCFWQKKFLPWCKVGVPSSCTRRDKVSMEVSPNTLGLLSFNFRDFVVCGFDSKVCFMMFKAPLRGLPGKPFPGFWDGVSSPHPFRNRAMACIH